MGLDAAARQAGHGSSDVTRKHYVERATVVQLATGPTTAPGGLSLQGASGHSEYPRFPDNGGLRTTNFNIAAVLAGLKPIEQQ